MAKSTDMRCTCGQMTWAIKNPALGSHIRCYCDSCQSAVRHLGKSEAYMDNGGTRIFQTVPHNVEITSGADHLALMRLSPKGLFRWYASCCDTPLGNTLTGPGLPFCGMVLPANHVGFGKVVAEVHTAGATNKVTQRGMFPSSMALMIRALAAKLAGKGKVTPFFDADGAPVSEPRVLTLSERNTARR